MGDLFRVTLEFPRIEDWKKMKPMEKTASEGEAVQGMAGKGARREAGSRVKSGIWGSALSYSKKFGGNNYAGEVCEKSGFYCPGSGCHRRAVF